MESCFAKSSNGSGKILNTCTISRKKSVLYCSILLRIIWILEICITYICVKHEYFVSAQIQVILIQIALLPSQMLELSYWLQLLKTFVSARIPITICTVSSKSLSTSMKGKMFFRPIVAKFYQSFNFIIEFIRWRYTCSIISK